MCFIELVDFNDVYQNNTDDKRKQGGQEDQSLHPIDKIMFLKK